MNISTDNTQNVYLINSKKISNKNAAEFYIPNIENIGDNNQNVENISVASDVDPLQVIEEMTGRITSSKPSYSVTEAEAEYFREKYGEKYNDDDPFKLFDELAEKNIISRKDAKIASRKSGMFWVEGFSPPEYNDDFELLNRLMANGQIIASAYYEKLVYGDSYDKYRQQNNTPITTWQDYVQDNYNYYQYIRDTDDVLFKADGNAFTNRDKNSFNVYCERTLKVQNVLAQIFGG